MKKYGVDNELKNKEIREKVKNTKMKMSRKKDVRPAWLNMELTIQ